MFTLAEGNIIIARFMNVRERPEKMLFWDDTCDLWVRAEKLPYQESWDLLIPICQKYIALHLTKKGNKKKTYHHAEFIQMRMYHMSISGVWEALVLGIHLCKK